ncbi:nicotinamide/nicotinic acid mononucleotide adenylyltransferase-like isoform X2 [Lotus japonicus]|uniref:nicotinamide/nicotinic acid mononucleotide adenylyltransferase-like isoform X2 n=1 Tax=Lotus japonicus TaxID=34305 RepID=UPI00258F38B2|nr:nicotinamide/nicotinic acid mononucleotide adenylyltransferase-like isoform X2 [Lotus japonicus]
MDVPLPLDKLALELISNETSPGNTSNKIYAILVATGSFNPPTFVHLRMFELARDVLNSKGYCVIGGYMSPANDAYKKKNLISAEHRIRLCHLACKSSEFVMVDPWEANQSTYQRTLTVLSRVHSSICETGLVSRESLKVMLVCGSDLLYSFGIPGFWIPDQVKTICRDYGVVCIRREGQDVEKTISDDEILNANQANIEVVDELVPNQISSTRVRIHSSFALRPHQWTLTAHSHRSIQKSLHQSQLKQLLLRLRFAMWKGSSHTLQGKPCSQNRCYVEGVVDCSEAFAREQAQFKEGHLLHASICVFGSVSCGPLNK